MTELLIDGDSLIYMAACSSKIFSTKLKDGGFYCHQDENYVHKVAAKTKAEVEELPFYPPISHAITKLKRSIEGILEAVSHEDFTIFIGGNQERNHKHLLYPAYKKNRTSEKPLHFSQVRQWLVKNYERNLMIAHHDEADHHVVLNKWHEGNDAIIAAIDKDVLYMTPGNHYNYKKGKWCIVTEAEAARNFALFVLSGDAGDNIPGLKGYGEPKYDDIGSLIEAGNTVKALPKIEFNEGGNYSYYLQEYLIAAYKVYKKELKNLPTKEREARFYLTCQLLWFPYNGNERIDCTICFDVVFNAK